MTDGFSRRTCYATGALDSYKSDVVYTFLLLVCDLSLGYRGPGFTCRPESKLNCPTSPAASNDHVLAAIPALTVAVTECNFL